MKSTTYYVTLKDGQREFSTESIGNDNCICKISDNSLKLYRKLTDDFEKVNKIILDSNSPSPRIIEGPELLKMVKENSIKDLLANAIDVKFFSEISGQFFVKSGGNAIFVDPRYGFNGTINEKLVIEPTDKTLKVKLYSQDLYVYKKSIKKTNFIQMVSFDIKNKLLRIFDKQCVGQKLRALNFKYMEQRSVLTNLPQEILNEIANQLVEMHSKENGKEYEKLENPSAQQLISFNTNPDFPGYLLCKNFLGNKFRSENLERTAFLKDAADFLGLDYDERFDELFEVNPYVFAFASAAKEAGIANTDKIIDLFLNIPNQNSYKSAYLLDGSVELSNFRKGLKTALKYRTEEEVLDGLSTMQYFYSDAFRGMKMLEDFDFFDGSIFDRFSYNKFNDHAYALVNVIMRENLQQICKEIIKGKTANTKCSLESYDVTDEEEIKKLAKIIKTDNGGFGRRKITDIKICYIGDNPCFVTKTEESPNWRTTFPSCSVNLTHSETNKIYDYECQLTKEEKDRAAKASEEDELPFF